jgi:protein-L-isoaspartate O-methyltransferase
MSAGPDWRARAETLTRTLRESDVVKSSQWARAFTEVPRHVFVPATASSTPTGT